ncbi:MAG: hypothetical protein LQ350_004861 [Teloschistes chrysophthalmus]|nr:MAG: hypothetical protein LQ350_004861 [Niorma chrysophthalma]
MAVKGGVFLPMYQREAMWIRFDSDDQFAINISGGGVNAISGEPLDYVVTPKQLWLDGIASTGGRVRQFVAMPMGAGYRVEAQVTGEEVTGGLQFQITLPKSHPLGRLQVLVKSLGKTIILQGFSDLATIAQLKKLIRSQVGIPTSQQRLIFCGMQLEDPHTIRYYDIRQESLIHLTLRLLGGGNQRLPDSELGVAAGGLIKQCIINDTYEADTWDRHSTIRFNVQILNSAVFRQVTGMAPPSTPISAATYASQGLPFFDIYNETSDIQGDFKDVKSVKQIDKVKSVAGKKHGREDDDDEPSYKNPIVILDSKGGNIGFRPFSELEKELANMNAVQF